MSQGEKGGGAQGGERKPKGWFCPIKMTIMTVIIIMRIICYKLLVLSVEKCPELWPSPRLSPLSFLTSSGGSSRLLGPLEVLGVLTPQGSSPVSSLLSLF